MALNRPHRKSPMMFRSSNITDFFKPNALRAQNKRSLPENEHEELRVAQRSRSDTPRHQDRTQQETAETESYTSDAVREEPAPSEGYLHGLIPLSKSSICDPAGSPLVTASTASTVSTANRREGMGSWDPQGPVLTSSQRVVKNGEIIIRNSDDESDTDTSLDDIDDLLLARKSAMVSSPPTEPDPPYLTSTRQKPQDIGTCTRSKTRGIVFATTPPFRSLARPEPPKYEFSLAALQQRSKDDKASEAGAAKARSLIDAFEKELEMRTSDPNKPLSIGAKLDATLLTSIMQKSGDGDDMDRLMTAMKRTEAFHQGRSWSFFQNQQNSSHRKLSEWPKPQWPGIFNDETFRQQAFIGGFIGDMISKTRVPDEILRWIVDAVCFEPRDDLRDSYIYTLEKSQMQVTNLLTPHLVTMLFQNVNASSEALDVQKPISPTTVLRRDEKDVDWSRLLSVLRLVSAVSCHLSVESKRHAVCLLCRLLLDVSVVKDCQVMVAVEEALISLVGFIAEEDVNQELQTLSSKIYRFATDSTLRLQMLQNIPAYSPRLSLLRRRLALAFFFEDELFLQKKPEDTIDFNSIVRHLQKSCFIIQNTTDYAELAALIAILSIGVDNGDPPPVGSNKQAETAFNADVDLLASGIKGIFTQIVDTGASHMKRTEAKEVLEAFQSQLLYAIRTKAKPKMTIWGEPIVDRQQKSIKEIFEAKRQKKQDDDSGG